MVRRQTHNAHQLKLLEVEVEQEVEREEGVVENPPRALHKEAL